MRDRVVVEGTGAWVVAAAIVVAAWIGTNAWDHHEHRANLYRCAELTAQYPDMVCPTPSGAKP